MRRFIATGILLNIAMWVVVVRYHDRKNAELIREIASGKVSATTLKEYDYAGNAKRIEEARPK